MKGIDDATWAGSVAMSVMVGVVSSYLKHCSFPFFNGERGNAEINSSIQCS